jgi:uncharacterized RDD family membrane protein YckC
MRLAEPCLQFLKREFEGKRQMTRAIRLLILLLVPSVMVAWWGGGPALSAREMGIKSPYLLRLHEPVSLIVTMMVLVLIWFVLGNEARKLEREIEKLDSK